MKRIVLFFIMLYVSVCFTNAQIPDGYEIVRTHNDDITWYELKRRDYYYASYNGKIIPSRDGGRDIYKSVEYFNGFFIFKKGYRALDCEAYDTLGKIIMLKDDGYSYPFFDSVVLKNEKVYFFKNIDKNSGYGCIFVYDASGKRIGQLEESDGYRFLHTEFGKRRGLVDFETFEVIFEPEFGTCGYLGDDLFYFYINDYVGVMNRSRKVVIPIDRHYTRIGYNRTFKIITFEKEGGYKGECNVKGVQTSISKIQQTESTESKPSSAASGENSTKKNTPSSSGSKSTAQSKPSGLLYKGEYTWGAQARVNGNLISGGMSNTSTIVIYEDYLESETFDISRHKYSKTLSNGTRIYVGTYGFGEESTIYVTSSFNLRMVVQNAPNQWGAQTTEYNFSKGKSFMYEYEDKGGGYSPSTSGGNNNNNSSNTTKQKKWCTHCGHSGRCATCNGKHWYYGIGGSKITCPNCKPDGACTWCNGTGER